MNTDSRKDIGRIGMSLAIAYYGANGYTVSIPLNDTQWYDLVIEKDGVFQTVQCKATATKTKEIQLRSTGGTNGGVYGNVLDNSVDLLFCVDTIDKILYNIPVSAIREAGNRNIITLRTAPNSNNQGFNTWLYQVTI